MYDYNENIDMSINKDIILTYIFICGITYNTFSGYIWTNQLVWLPIAVFLTIHPNESDNDSVEITSSDDDQDNAQSLIDENNG